MKTNKTTVLEKLGINIEMIRFFRSKGLVVPSKIKASEKPLRSPSEEWFYSVADRFTPPLDEAEVEVFKKIPYLFSLRVLKAIELERDVSTVLYSGLEKVKTKLRNEEEKIAAVLSILRIFHGCLDNTLKYDRHLEYHEYEESPVGYIWQRFKKKVSKAAQKMHVQNPESWANQKLLEILSGHRRIFFTIEYSICCKEVYNELKKKISNIDLLSGREIIEKIQVDFPEFFKIIKEYSKGFYRLPEEFIADCLVSKDMNPSEKTIKNKRISKEALEAVCSKLSENEANELERIVEIIEDFSVAQELVGVVGSGSHPDVKNRVLDVLIKGYDQLQTLLSSNMNLIKKEFRGTVSSLLKAEDVPSKFIADREFVTVGEDFFEEKVRELYISEIERWEKTL